jgi:hypothetical protein
MYGIVLVNAPGAQDVFRGHIASRRFIFFLMRSTLLCFKILSCLVIIAFARVSVT